MKKYLPLAFILLFAIISIAPSLALSAVQQYTGNGLVPCGNSPGEGVPAGTTRPCELGDFFTMLAIIYDFLVKWIATPLAVLSITIGAIFMLFGAGDPSLFTKGRDFVKWALIGLALVWCSWLIIDFVLKGLLGYQGNWSSI